MPSRSPHAGDARGHVHGRGRKATGARAQSLPIKNIAVGLPYPAVPGGCRKSDANRSYARSRKPLAPTAARTLPREGRDGSFFVGEPGRPTAPPPSQGGAGRKTQPRVWKVTPGDRHKSRMKPGQALPCPGLQELFGRTKSVIPSVAEGSSLSDKPSPLERRPLGYAPGGGITPPEATEQRRPCHRNSLRRAPKALQRALRLAWS